MSLEVLAIVSAGNRKVNHHSYVHALPGGVFEEAVSMSTMLLHECSTNKYHRNVPLKAPSAERLSTRHKLSFFSRECNATMCYIIVKEIFGRFKPYLA